VHFAEQLGAERQRLELHETPLQCIDVAEHLLDVGVWRDPGRVDLVDVGDQSLGPFDPGRGDRLAQQVTDVAPRVQAPALRIDLGDRRDLAEAGDIGVSTVGEAQCEQLLRLGRELRLLAAVEPDGVGDKLELTARPRSDPSGRSSRYPKRAASVR